MQSGELIVGKYRLKQRLGVGGMGEVWSAQHTATDREFAIKFMHGHVASSEQARQRFSREARASARINHPNIIDVFDVGEHAEGLFLVMEMLDGIPLADAFYVVPPLSVRDLVSILLDTARALAAAHAVGIIHRDIKPGNIFLHRDRVTGLAYAKLLDFGISKFSANEDSFATKTGSVLGSPRYMSPEQAKSAAAADHRADIWSMGVILFEGVTGVWPHDGDSFSSLVVAIATTPPLSIDTMAPHLPRDFRSIIRDCLSPIEDRLSSALELAARLEAVLQNGDLADVPLPRPMRPPGDGRSFSTAEKLRVGTPPRSKSAGDIGSTSTGFITARQPFGPDAQRPGVTTAESAALTTRQPSALEWEGAPSLETKQTLPMPPRTVPGPGPVGTPHTPGAAPVTQPPASPRSDSTTQPFARAPNVFADTSPTPFPQAARTLASPGGMAGTPQPGGPGGDTALRSQGPDPLTASVSSVVATVALEPPKDSASTTGASARTSVPIGVDTLGRSTPFASRLGGPLGIAAAVLTVMAIGIGIALVSVMRAPSPVATGEPTAAPASGLVENAGDTPATATPTASADTAPPTPASAQPAPTTSASVAAPASASPKSAGTRPGVPPTQGTQKPPGAKKGDPSSKVEKLGSGL